MIRPISCLVALLAAASVAHAEGHAVGFKAGALGLGLEYSYGFSERLGVRIALNGGGLGTDLDEAGIDYDVDLTWDSLSAAVDFHPLRSPLRLTAGVLANDNRLDAVGRSSGDVTIGDTTYTQEQVGTLAARVSFDAMSPFLGIGWDWSKTPERRFGVSLDLGIVAQGAPRVTLTATGTVTGDPAFADDLQAEAAELRDELDQLDVLPYLELGFIFRF